MPLFQHPLQLYTLDHPEGWEVRYDEKTGGVVFVVSGAGGAPWALNLTPLAITGRALAATQELERAASRVALRVAEGSQSTETDGQTEQAYLHGDRANSEGIGAHMRLWVVRNRTLALLGTQLGPGTEEDAARRMGDAAIASLRFPELLPPTPEEFRRRVMEVITSEYAPYEPVGQGSWGIELRATRGEAAVALSVENLYRAVLLEMESAGALIRDFLDRFIRSLAMPGSYDDFAAVRGRILPMLKPTNWTEDARQLVVTAFAPGLSLYFAVDEPQMVAYVTVDLLEKWDLPVERIQEVALDNLARTRPDLKLMALPGDDQRPVALVVSTHDGFDVSRLALPSLRDTFAEELGDTYLVGLPNRDFLIAFSERDAETAGGIIRQVKHDYQRMDHPITPVIYRVHPDRIEPTER